MPRITFIMPDGTEKEIDAEVGRSIMENARRAGVNGIEGDCGGNLSCATCHVCVEAAYLDKLSAVDNVENELLDFVADGRKPNSRLSCQIIMDSSLDGIRIGIPNSQY